jgi:Uma2 family endonuclease
METARKFTSADLLQMPDDGNRYEIIEGDLYVSKLPSAEHQFVCTQLGYYFQAWNKQSGAGGSLDRAGHFTRAPELVVEVLSPGKRNEHRDRVAKLGLYSRRGVSEYWIVNWIQRLVDVYRREGAALKHVATLNANDALESPMLPGFSCQVAELFFTKP